MKKLVFIFLLCLITIFSDNFAITPEQQNVMVTHPTLSTTSFLKNIIAQCLIMGVSFWALGEIACDVIHRYKFCKEVAIKYAQELREDSANILSEREIKVGSFIQGLSVAPRIWWREISATALLIAFIACARKTLITS